MASATTGLSEFAGESACDKGRKIRIIEQILGVDDGGYRRGL
jgi:hypothetical protein